MPPTEIGLAPDLSIEAPHEPHDRRRPRRLTGPRSACRPTTLIRRPSKLLRLSRPGRRALRRRRLRNCRAGSGRRPTSRSRRAQEAQEAAAAPAENETVTVWRFARTPGPRHPKPHHRQARRKFPAVHPQGAPAQPVEGPQDGEAAGATIRAESAARQAGRPATVGKPAHDARQKPWGAPKAPSRPDERRDGRPSAGTRSGAERKPAIDPMSPFAKLMELRSILESESKKRN